jgi:hypothetical protein
MKQIRQFTYSDGLVVLTSHNRPALIVMEIEYCVQLLYRLEQLAQLLAASNLVESAQAVSAVDASEFGNDHDWIKRALDDLQHAESISPRIRKSEHSPRDKSALHA